MIAFKNRHFIRSLGFAWRGITQAWRDEANIRRQLYAVPLVLLASWWWGVSPEQLGLIILAIGLVITFELCNSALEALADIVEPRRHAGIQRVKDMAAGAVLVAGIAALVVGAIVLYN